MQRLATILSAMLISVGCGDGAAPSPEAASPEGGPAPSPTSAPSPVPAPSPTPRPTDENDEREGPLRVWVAVEEEGRVVEVDLRRGRAVQSFDVSGRPHNVTVHRGTTAVALQGSGRIALIDPDASPPVTEVALGGSPHDVKASGSRFFVANEGAARIDVVSRQGRHVGSIPLDANPHDLAVAPGGETAWVSLNGTDRMAVVDLDERTVRRYVPTGHSPHDLLFAPDGTLWVTDWEGLLHVFSWRGERLRSIPLGQEAHHLAFTTPEVGQAWITDHGARKVFVLDTETLEVIDEIPTPGAPHHVAIVGARAAVADHETGDVLVYRVPGGSRAARIPVGHGPHGVWAATADLP